MGKSTGAPVILSFHLVMTCVLLLKYQFQWLPGGHSGITITDLGNAQNKSILKRLSYFKCYHHIVDMIALSTGLS